MPFKYKCARRHGADAVITKAVFWVFKRTIPCFILEYNPIYKVITTMVIRPLDDDPT